MTSVTDDMRRLAEGKGKFAGLPRHVYLAAQEGADRIAALERDLRRIAGGTIRRGRNVSYGGGRVGVMSRKEMMEVARTALAAAEKP